MTAPHPVVVIGNGPVGQTAALLLARWGISVLVLDAREQRDAAGSKAICQQRDVLDIWCASGAGERIAAEGVTWTTARTYYQDKELFAYSFSDPGRSTLPPFVNISQSRTEELLDEQIATQPLITVRWGHQVNALEQDSDGVTLTCDGERTIRAEYVLACAGARADGLRETVGVGFEGHSFDDRFLICDIRAELPGWANERRFHFDPAWNPGRQVLIHPCPDSTFRIDWQVPADYDLAEEEGNGGLDRRIRAIVGETRYEVVWKSLYRFHSRLVRRMRAGRVLLAGDCAHLYSPFGARGLNSGVADAENAAWKIAYVLHGWADPELLESYHAERHAAAVENLSITNATMDFLIPRTREHHDRRLSTLELARRDPLAHRLVDSGRLAEPFWYDESPLTTRQPERPFGGRPERGHVPGPGPGVLLPDWPMPGGSRLRELARDGFLVLCGPGEEVLGIDSPGPIRVLEMDAALAEMLAARPGELWVVRPDAHIAAVLTAAERHRIGEVLRRARGYR